MSQHLNRHDAEQLLGGYATGTLTEAERRDLMTAALNHQALFDALADEEVLRELLADPAARAELLAALAEAPAPKVVPFWRRHPGPLGLAASLLIAVTAGVAYLRTPTAPELRKAPAVPIQESVAPPAKPAPAAEAAPPAHPMPRRERDKETPAPAGAREDALRSEPTVRPDAAPASPAPPPPPPPIEAAKAKALQADTTSRAQDHFAKEMMEKKAERKVAKEAPATAAEVASGGALAAAPTVSRPQGAPANLASGVVGGVVARPPSWAFVKGPEGDLWLRLTHARGTYPYLLRRTAEGPILVAATPLPPAAQGERLTRFLLPPDPGPMDLYVLAAPAPEPLKLPADGPSPGFRARLEVPAN